MTGGFLAEVPALLKTRELCRTAVEQDWRSLAFVPETLKTPELCRAAVEQQGGALRVVPEALKTSELCRTAVEQYGRDLMFVPEALNESATTRPWPNDGRCTVGCARITSPAQTISARTPGEPHE
jgi:hypothetical protein